LVQGNHGLGDSHLRAAPPAAWWVGSAAAAPLPPPTPLVPPLVPPPRASRAFDALPASLPLHACSQWHAAQSPLSLVRQDAYASLAASLDGYLRDPAKAAAVLPALGRVWPELCRASHWACGRHLSADPPDSQQQAANPHQQQQQEEEQQEQRRRQCLTGQSALQS
jgi:hypothetical protein